jgi:uncharacterized membrane protein
MWGPGPWGAWMGGLWWICPLIGLFVALALAVVVFRLMSAGRGFMCMGEGERTGASETAEMRGEIRALREELNHLKPSR